MTNRDLVFPFLPKTTGGGGGDPHGGYQFSGSAGTWHHDPIILTKFPSDMIVGKDRVESRLLTSIPDVWARAQFFNRALLNEGHPGHLNVVDEWRGLLAMICFAEAYDLNLTVEPIDLIELAAPAPTHPPIARPLLEMCPGEAFNRFHLIKADGVLIGATSPLSFVFTPPDYRAPQIVPWRDAEGRLSDPTNYLSNRGGTFQEMLQLLKGWLVDLQRLSEQLGLPSDDINLLAGVFNKWIESITVPAENVDKKGAREIPIISGRVSIFPLAHIAAAGGDVPSDVRIDTGSLRKGFTFGGRRSPLVYWKSGWKQGRLVYGLFDSQHVGEPQGTEGNMLADGKIDHPWINPEKLFFTDTIAKVELERGSVRCRGGENFLLPLREGIIEYFDPGFLESNFELQLMRDKTVNAVLRIPLEKGETVEITRSYPPEKQVTSIERDAVVLWPNVKLDEWKHYYLFARYPEKGPGEWSCKALGATVIGSSEVETGENLTAHIWRFDGPPEVVVFRQGKETLGLCLPKFGAPPVQLGSNKWDISVDFGTSNTAVAARDRSAKEPITLDFEPRHLILMALPEGPSMVVTVTKNFFALNRQYLTTPFPSVYYPFRMQDNPEAVLDGNVPFEQTFLVDFQEEDAYDDYVTGLKWETEEVALGRANQFLNYVLILGLLELRLKGAKEVLVRWTYPSSFEESRRTTFETAWRAIKEALAKSTGLDLSLPEPVSEDGDPSITESVAVCQYAKYALKMAPASDNLAALTIDIGGETSDIAMWLNSRMIAQSSLRLGADLIAGYIRDNARFRKLWVQWRKIADMYQAGWESALTGRNYLSAVNESLRFGAEDIQQGIRQRAGVGPEEKRFLSLVVCLHSAVAFYTALVLRSALKGSDNLEGMDVLLSGNGSRSIGWFGDETAYSPLLKRFLAAGYGKTSRTLNIKVILSPEPKLEVAKGIISELPFAITDIPTPVVPVGEDGIAIDGTSLDRSSDLSAVSKETVVNSSFTVSGELPVLRSFLALYNEVSKKHEALIPVKEDELDFARIQAAIKQQLHDYSRHPNDVSVVAPFVTGVRRILDHLAGRK